MRKVITINLNNNAYQVEDDGYEALEAYLATAESRLAANPDRAEILADLEQAIADKCDSFLGAHKNVVTAVEVVQILKDMGPVEGNGEPAAEPPPIGAAGARPDAAPGAAASAAAPRRLYRIREKRMIGGVCTGLAAYFGVDVVWVRIIFVLLTLLTGVWFAVYLALLIIVPQAETAEECAAAHGQEFNAQELVDRAKKKYEQYRSGALRRRARRKWERYADDAGPRPGYAARITAGLLLPVFTLVSAALFVALLLSVAALFGHRDWLGVHYWTGLPGWVLAVALLMLYGLLEMPVRAGRRAAAYYANGGHRHGWADMWSGLLWLTLTAALLWAAYWGVPGLHDLLRQLSSGVHSLTI